MTATVRAALQGAEMNEPRTSFLIPPDLKDYGFVASRNERALSLIHESFLAELFPALLCEYARDLTEQPIAARQRGRWLGRGRIANHVLPSGRGIVLRQFMRGGWISKVNQELFLRTRRRIPRPFRELRSLAFLVGSGVRTPFPVAALVEPAGVRCYRGFIATAQIEDAYNLLDLGYRAKADVAKSSFFIDSCYGAGKEARRMLQAGVVHADLHPGNILVSESEGLYLIDFDGAGHIDSEPTRMILDRLVHRWRRATRKHDLSALADEPFCRGLGVSMRRGAK